MRRITPNPSAWGPPRKKANGETHPADDAPSHTQPEKEDENGARAAVERADAQYLEH